MSVAVRFEGVVPQSSARDWPGPLDLEVPEGAFCVVETPPAIAWHLLRLCIGLREPARGRVEVLGTDPGALDRFRAQAFRRRLGVGFGEPAGLVSNLTIRMNLLVPLLYSGAADLASATRRTEETLDACGLAQWADRRPAELPPDVRREAVIARAIARDPELLLLEEPTASLRDAQAAWLLSLCRQNAGTILATTIEREGILYELASMVISVDERGTMVVAR